MIIVKAECRDINGYYDETIEHPNANDYFITADQHLHIKIGSRVVGTYSAGCWKSVSNVEAPKK